MKKFQISTRAIVLVPVAVGINYIGKAAADLLKLPLWLDSVGTIIAGMLAGPLVGGITGALNNAVYGLTVSPVAFIYMICSIFIGFYAGLVFKKRRNYSMLSLLLFGIILGFLAALISTFINLWLWGGQTGNIWGDSLFLFLRSHEVPLYLAAFLNEFFVDCLDKTFSVLITYHIWHALPMQFIELFRASSFKLIKE